MKLWIFTSTRTAMVWAETEGEALSQGSKIEDLEDPVVEATEAAGKRADGWTDHDNVYQDSEGNLTLLECEQLIAAQPQKDTHTLDLFPAS